MFPTKLADKGIQCRLLSGIEPNILPNDKFDFPDDLLAEVDVVVASIHQGFTQTEFETTQLTGHFASLQLTLIDR